MLTDGQTDDGVIGILIAHLRAFGSGELKSLEPSHGILQLLKKNLYSVLILHLLKSLFSVFHVLQALGIFVLF